ncbi:FtsW/RodA/SpoVE family cell cycle protein, partial [Streptomyces sp. NPDC001393]
PFLAQGGSSMVANWLLVAVLIKVSDTARRPPPIPAADVSAAETQFVRP